MQVMGDVDVHQNPATLSDGPQSLTPENFASGHPGQQDGHTARRTDHEHYCSYHWYWFNRGTLGSAWHELPQVSTIIGIDNDEESLHKALQMGAIDEMTSLENGVERADVVFLCTPLQTFPGIIAQVAQHVRPGTLVTDVGSTKQKVMEWLGCLPDGVHFGGHPKRI